MGAPRKGQFNPALLIVLAIIGCGPLLVAHLWFHLEVSCLTSVCFGLQEWEKESCCGSVQTTVTYLCAWHVVSTLSNTMISTNKKWPRVPSSSQASAQGGGQNGEGARGAKNLWMRTGHHKRNRTCNKPKTMSQLKNKAMIIYPNIYCVSGNSQLNWNVKHLYFWQFSENILQLMIYFHMRCGKCRVCKKKWQGVVQ